MRQDKIRDKDIIVCEGSLQDKITIYISYLIDSGKD